MTQTVKPRGFTLIELLVVIAIIALLLGLALPGLQMARTASKKASSQAFVNTLQGAINSYRMDKKLGSYPPSFWDTNVAGAGSPYEGKNQVKPGEKDDPSAPIGANFTAAGAQTLVWALVGADFKGTPGFAGDLAGLYELTDPPGLKPVKRRTEPFVDAKQDNIRALEDLRCGVGAFEDAKKAPVFVDAFENPILYFRWANRPETTTAHLGYEYLDNEGLMPFKSSKAAEEIFTQDYIVDTEGATLGGGERSFNTGGFLLITAGADGEFGKFDDDGEFVNWGDDVKNFGE